jgi:hypothetical protein
VLPQLAESGYLKALAFRLDAMPIRNRFAELLPEITGWRHDFHQHPELLYEVHRTADKVAGLLREFGCDEVVTGIGRTGVVGVIRGRDRIGPGGGLARRHGRAADHEQTGAACLANAGQDACLRP